jgi:hypothetical protein
MGRCDLCGRIVSQLFECENCGGSFCEEHKIPEKHGCPRKYVVDLASLRPASKATVAPSLRQVRGLQEEYELVRRMDREFDEYLDDLLKHRLDETIEFGKRFSAIELAVYLVKNFGKILFFDPLLTLTQQYAIADVEVVNEAGGTSGRTGFNLALFGDPGTGKTFASKDFILGDPDKGVPAHGLPGRNRYCGGMTPAKFIQIGKAYEGKKYVFIVTEFREWFTRSPGMVEPLKLAMEHGVITKETYREVIEPYRFTSFFSVNYNAIIKSGKEYKVSMKDPNFNAVEDRMLCRLHVLTKERYQALAEAQARAWLGETRYELARKIRDHVTLVHAIETEHPKVEGSFSKKPILLTRRVVEIIRKARETILEHIGYKDTLGFSPRLEMRALQLASAFSLISYFKYEDKDVIPIDEQSIRLALRFYVEEAAIRSKESFDPHHILFDLGVYLADEDLARGFGNL